MFEHILVAIDGSVYSESSLPAAIEVAKKFGSELLVFRSTSHASISGTDFTSAFEAGPLVPRGRDCGP
ncbi:MAG: universal stress protein [Chloroflexi bacterium]|nr:MAG: universal stress protein [Chloroflexota bacterium]